LGGSVGQGGDDDAGRARRTMPPSDFDRVELSLYPMTGGWRWFRLYKARHPNPLGFGSKEARSRFSDPRNPPPEDQFRVIYLAENLKTCFSEVFVRDRKDRRIEPLPISRQELAEYSVAEIKVVSQMPVLDLFHAQHARMSIPTDVTGWSDHALSQQWSLAFWRHPQHIQGIVYRSRFTGARNIALYDRSVYPEGPRNLGVLRVRPLLSYPSELRRLIDENDIVVG